MIALYKDGCLYGDRILHGRFIAWKFCRGRRLPGIKQSECAVNLSGSKQKLVLSLVASPLSYEPRHEKPGFLHMRKQRRRSASR